MTSETDVRFIERRWLPQLTDGQLEALKWIALVSMIIDHVGRYGLHGPLDSWAFALGRLAFPLFAIVLAINLARPGDRVGRAQRVARRLALWAAIAMLPSWWARGELWPVNVLGTLGLGAWIVWVLESTQPRIVQWTTVSVALLASVAFEFGPPGVLLVAGVYCCHVRKGVEWIGLAGGSALFLAGMNGLLGGLLALWMTLASIASPWFALHGNFAVSRYAGFFYWFYPVHLAAIGLWRTFAE